MDRHRGIMFLLLAAITLPGVSAISDDVPLIVASAVSFFMLLILIVVIVFATCFSDSWIHSIMKREGKVKVSRSYLRKKKDAKRQLLLASKRSSRTTNTSYLSHNPNTTNGINNGNPPRPTMMGPAPIPVTVMDKDQMVQGWNQNATPYEEKTHTMELGEENEQEFQIETDIVDNEVLDVGPFTNMESSSARPVQGSVYNSTYLYSNKDRNSTAPFIVPAGTDVGDGLPGLPSSTNGTGVVSAMSSGGFEPMTSNGSIKPGGAATTTTTSTTTVIDEIIEMGRSNNMNRNSSRKSNINGGVDISNDVIVM